MMFGNSYFYYSGQTYTVSLDFPNNPSMNQTYTFNSRNWKWNGSYWESLYAKIWISPLNRV